MDGAGGVMHPASGRGSSVGGMRPVAPRGRADAVVLSLRYCLLASLLLVAMGASAARASDLYTWPGWEPDKGATAWYWVRFVDPRAGIHIVPAGTNEAPGTLFDTPSAAFRRSQSSSTLESVLRKHPSTDPAVMKLAQIAHDIEINAWRPRVLPESNVLEAAFRRLQQHWPNSDPPVPCILAFFDHVHGWLRSGGGLDESMPAACANAERKGKAQ